MYLEEIFLERVKPETHVVSYVSQWASTENTIQKQQHPHPQEQWQKTKLIDVNPKSESAIIS